MEPPLAAPLLARIAAYLEATGMAESYLGRLAVNDSTVVERLRQGRVTIRVADQLDAYMRANPPSRSAA